MHRGKPYSVNDEQSVANNLHSERIRLGKLDISYLTGGQGYPLIIIHGGGNSGKVWLRNAEELSKHYSIYVPDLPGFGNSQSIDDNFRLTEFVVFVEEFSKSLGLQRFHLVGHSLGGGIALLYALEHPYKINRLVLVSSICLGKEIALWARFLSQLTFCKPVEKASLYILKVVKWLGRLFCARFELSNLRPQVKIGVGKSIMTLKGQTTVLLSRLSELLVPALLVWGAKDGIVPVRHAYAAAQLIPDCQLHVFRGCGHSVYKQKVQEFSQLLEKFLR